MSTEPKRFMRIIVNGKAAGNMELRTAVGALRDRGHRIDVRVTWEAADAARMASNAGLEELCYSRLMMCSKLMIELSRGNK